MLVWLWDWRQVVLHGPVFDVFREYLESRVQEILLGGGTTREIKQSPEEAKWNVENKSIKDQGTIPGAKPTVGLHVPAKSRDYRYYYRSRNLIIASQ